MKYLGVDIGGTAVKIGLVTQEGEILSTDTYDVAFDGYDTPILSTVLDSVDIFLENEKILPEELSGIGVSATGQIDSVLGKVIGSGGNIKNWQGTAIKEGFENKYHVKTTVVNDANCVAIGEQWVGRGKGYVNVIVITVGTGVGGGIIVDSNILLGSRGIAGEIGHFSINNRGVSCHCGNKGCYEKYASMTALVKMVREKIEDVGIPGLDESEVDGKRIFELFAQGNAVIKDIVEEWIGNVASGLVGLAHIFNPDIILIGGGVSGQEELFVAKVREKVLASVMDRFGEMLQIEAVSMGNNAGLVGAVYYCMKNK